MNYRFIYILPALLLLSCGSARQAADIGPAFDPVTVFGGRTPEAIEGIWQSPDTGGEIAVVRDAENRYPEAAFAGYAAGDFSKPVLLIAPSREQNVYTVRYYEERDSYTPALLKFSGGDAALLLLPERQDSPPEERLLFRTFPPKPERQREKSVGTAPTGTGFFVTQNVVATNYHLVEGTDGISVFWGQFQLPAAVVAADPVNDIALLEVSFAAAGAFAEIAAASIRPLPAGNDRAVSPGDSVTFFDFPLRNDYFQNARFERGKILRLSGANNDYRLFGFSGAVKPGNSGSPLFDRYGNVVGIVTSLVNNFTITKVEQPFSGTVTEVSRRGYSSGTAVKVRYLDRLMKTLPSGAELYPGGRKPLGDYELANARFGSVVIVQGILK